MLDKRISDNYISTRGATCAHRKPASFHLAGFFSSESRAYRGRIRPWKRVAGAWQALSRVNQPSYCQTIQPSASGSPVRHWLRTL